MAAQKNTHISTQKSAYAFGFLCALLGATLWGFSGICAEILVDQFAMAPAFITAVRAPIAAIPLVIIALVRRRERVLEILHTPRAILMIFIAGFGMFMSQYSYVETVAATNAATATVLQTPSCLIVMLVVCLRFKRWPGWSQVVGLVLAVGGTWLIATGGDPSTLATPVDGLLWGLVNCCAIALYVMCPKSLYERWGSSAPVALCTAADAIISLVFLSTRQIFAPLPTPIITPWSLLVLIGGASFLGTAVAFSLFMHGVSKVGSITGTLLGAVEPLSATILAILLLGTQVGWADWVGMAMMIAMLFFVALPVRSDKKAKQELEDEVTFPDSLPGPAPR